MNIVRNLVKPGYPAEVFHSILGDRIQKACDEQGQKVPQELQRFVSSTDRGDGLQWELDIEQQLAQIGNPSLIQGWIDAIPAGPMRDKLVRLLIRRMKFGRITI